MTARRHDPTPLRLLLALVIALALGASLVACGGGGGSEPADEEREESRADKDELDDKDERDDEEERDRADERDAEREIENQIDTALTIMVEAEPEDVELLLGEETCAEMEAMGIEPAEFYQALFSKLDYSIDDVSVSGDEATVDMTVTNVDVPTAMADYEGVLEAWLETDEALEVYAEGGEDALMAAAMQLFVDSLASDDAPTFTQEVTLDMERGRGGEWDFADDDALGEALFGGMDVDEELGADLGEVFEV